MAKKLLKSGMIFSAMTLISRVLGLIRDMIIANLMGAGAAADVFILVNKIPNFLRRLFAEGAFAQAFVPVLTEYKEKQGFDQTQLLIARASGTLGTLLTLVTLIGVVGSPVLIAIFANGWFVDWLNDGPAADNYELASSMLKITFPYLLFISLTALSGAILNTYGKFAAAAFTPVILNISMIVGALVFADHFEQPAYALAWAVFLGGLLQLLFQLPFLLKLKVLKKPQWGWRDPGVTKIRTLMIPAMFGVSVSQINLLLDTLLASFLEKGSISWLYYSDRLLEFPLGLFGIAISTVILPQLAKEHTQQTSEAFSQTLDWGLFMVCLLGLPSAIGLAMLAKPMLTVLFMHGAFDQVAVSQSAKSLMAYSAGLLSFMLIKVLASGFYSRQDTKTPVKIGIKAMIVNMVFNLILIYPLAHVGLALATAMSAAFNAGYLYFTLKTQGVYQVSSTNRLKVLKVLVASMVMASCLWLVNPSFEVWLDWTRGEQVLMLVALIGGAAVVYFAMLLSLGLRPRHLKA